MSGLSKKAKEEIHKEWIINIAQTESLEDIQKHVIKHAAEIYERDPMLWAASMENLLDIYRAKVAIEYTVDHKIERLANHHTKNKAKGPSPPKKIKLEDWVSEELLRELE